MPLTPEQIKLLTESMDWLRVNQGVDIGPEVKAVLPKLIMQESGWKTNAQSPKGAFGLGQLMQGTANELGVDRNNPVQNVAGSAKYLQQQWDTTKSMPLSLAGYNAGPGAVKKHNGIPPYTETQGYVKDIMDNVVDPKFGGNPRTYETSPTKSLTSGATGQSSVLPNKLDQGQVAEIIKGLSSNTQQGQKKNNLLPLLLSVGIPGVIGAIAGSGTLLGPLGGLAVGAGGAGKSYMDTQAYNDKLQASSNAADKDLKIKLAKFAADYGIDLNELQRKILSDKSLDDYRKGKLDYLNRKLNGEKDGPIDEKNPTNKFIAALADTSGNKRYSPDNPQDIQEFSDMLYTIRQDPSTDKNMFFKLVGTLTGGGTEELDEAGVKKIMSYYNNYLTNRRNVKDTTLKATNQKSIYLGEFE